MKVLPFSILVLLILEVISPIQLGDAKDAAATSLTIQSRPCERALTPPSLRSQEQLQPSLLAGFHNIYICGYIPPTPSKNANTSACRSFALPCMHLSTWGAVHLGGRQMPQDHMSKHVCFFLSCGKGRCKDMQGCVQSCFRSFGLTNFIDSSEVTLLFGPKRGCRGCSPSVSLHPPPD